MNKNFIYIVFTLLLFSFITVNVSALTKKEVITNSTLILAESQEEGCDAIFGDPEREGSVGHFLQQIFNTFKFLAPSLVIVLSIIDFIKAAANQDKDALVKATGKSVKRLVLALILFFIPTLINFLFDILGWYGTCGIG